MKTNFVFTTTSQKSSNSHVAQVMNDHELDRAVYFILRGGSDAQREELRELISSALIDWYPILNRRHPRRLRDIIICRAHDNVDDLQHIETYRSVLEYVLGKNCRITVRVVWRAAL